MAGVECGGEILPAVITTGCNLGALEEQVGDATHGRDNDQDLCPFCMFGAHEPGRQADRVCTADGSAAKFHYAKCGHGSVAGVNRRVPAPAILQCECLLGSANY